MTAVGGWMSAGGSLPQVLFTLMIVVSTLSGNALAQTSARDMAGGLQNAPRLENPEPGPNDAKTSNPTTTVSVPEPNISTVGTWNQSKMWGGGGSGIDLFKRFAADQSKIWTSPLRLRRRDAIWALPTAAAMAAFLASDSWFSKQVPASEIARSRSVSNDGAFALAGAAGGMFLIGKIRRNDHASETGFLAIEAAVNAAAVDYSLKSVFDRQRPYQGAGSGHFFAGGSSFPSEHAAVSWAVAGVIAHEYPGPLTKLLAYGLASAVTVARVTGKEHFPSDVLAGGALGYFAAQQIYQRHRDPEVSPSPWGNPFEFHAAEQDKVRSPRHMGSPYVPLDSWVYPALEQLAALGYLQTAYLGMRPWTRMECTRLLEEAGDVIRYAGDGEQPGGEAPPEVQKTYAALLGEFGDEIDRRDGAANVGLGLDSIYTRFTAITGTPLRDGYHFAQTIVNDYGRPYGEGFNQITGVSVSGVAGPFSFSFRGEYQHAPEVASNPANVLQATAAEDGLVALLPDGSATINQFRLIQGAIGLTVNNVKISFGKQNLWLGPGESGPLLMSDNAAPITMLQIDNVSPFEIPLLSHFLGPVRMTSFLGQLAGQSWVYNPPVSVGLAPSVDPQFLVGPNFHPQPFIHGNKIGFHPTPNLEFGMGVTAMFGGPGLPFTWNEFFRSYYSHNANTASNPAKRFSSFDLMYRVPGVRKWLTVYTDSLVGDEVSPLGSTRPMLNPGIYLPQAPKLPRLELRVEGFKADPRLGTMYTDRRYRSGYTNDGNLIGSWVGRQALGGQAWTRYSFSPRTSVQLSYRHQEVDRFLAGGGRLNDFSLSARCQLGPQVELSGQAQYEQWNFPALRPGPESDFSMSLQLTYHPGLRWWRQN
ncbi:MAG: capsule assembly Wzi family protein [Candidatus Sulfotelmatobacter sp.]